MFGLSFDPFVNHTVLMPIVDSSFYSACRVDDPEDCDCIKMGSGGTGGGESTSKGPSPGGPDEETTPEGSGASEPPGTEEGEAVGR